MRPSGFRAEAGFEPLFQFHKVGGQRQPERAQFGELLAQLFLDLVLVFG